MKKPALIVGLILHVLWITSPILAQPTNEGEKVIQQVFDMLSGKNNVVKDAPENLLGAWEALAYLEDTDTMSIEDLQEAVPDYYHFRKDDLILKLINPENYNEYGVEVNTGYRLTADQKIELLAQSTDKAKETWTIIYLDENYLALDMGQLRVFFTPTTPQE